MIVNIHDYVDRYLNNYIYYHWQHFSDSGESDAAAYLFEGKYQEAIESISAATFTVQSQTDEINNANKPMAAEVLDIADQLANGELLADTLDQIALEVNNMIDRQAQNIDYDKLYKAALSYSGMAQNGNVQYATVRAFLQLLTYALDQAGGYNAQFLNELRWFGKTLTGRKKFNFNPGNAKIVSQEQLTNLSKIQNALIRAGEKFQQSGKSLSAASFQGTIVYIFTQVISNAIASNLLKNTFQDAERQIDNILISLGCKPEAGSSPQKQSNSYAKIKVIDADGLQLQVTQNNNTAIIEIGTNMQVHWVNSSGSQVGGTIIARTTIGQMFPDNAPNKYYAYNLMAHRDQFPEEYGIMKASIAASFMRDTVMGANKRQANQFLMINGRIYPIITIIKNICDEYMRNQGQTGQFGIAIQEPVSGSNRWQTDEYTRGPNVRLALLRSQLINNIISKLSINLNYNSNILSNYIK